jgi:hypothetical protein
MKKSEKKFRTKMQNLPLLLLSSFIILFNSCSEASYTYEIDPRTHDTINVTTERGKQGRWIVNTDCAGDLPKLPKDTIALPDSVDIARNQGYIFVSNQSVMTIGNYADGRKQGTWISYGKDGSITKIEEYKDDILVVN